jgi:hypothetical protein
MNQILIDCHLSNHISFNLVSGEHINNISISEMQPNLVGSEGGLGFRLFKRNNRSG